MYRVETTQQFDEDVQNLDPQVARRTIKKLEWLATNAQAVFHERLNNIPEELQILCKCRAGDHRILYWIDHEKQIIYASGVGHRREIYRRLST